MSCIFMPHAFDGPSFLRPAFSVDPYSLYCIVAYAAPFPDLTHIGEGDAHSQILPLVAYGTSILLTPWSFLVLCAAEIFLYKCPAM